LGLTRYLAAGSGNELTGFFYSIMCHERPEARTSALTEEEFMNRGDKVMGWTAPESASICAREVVFDPLEAETVHGTD
jgi:hypothetical protein